MGQIQRKNVRMINQGMNWNRTIDTIPDGQICLGYNVRATQKEEIVSRPGLTGYSTLATSPVYAHSISRLNNYSGNLPLFSNVYVIGADSKIFVGKSSVALNNAAINPIKLPPSGSTTSMSGNPLAMVDAATINGSSGWKYVGDSTQNLTVGYNPGDTPDTNMARAYTMGILPPVFNPLLGRSGVGLGTLTGNYQWRIVFRRKFTGAQSNPSAPSRWTLTTPMIPMNTQSIVFTLPTTPIDPQTGSPDANIVIDLYRFGGTIFRWALVGANYASGAVGIVDNLADAQILTAPAPTEVVDATTGVTRFPTYQPFTVPDIGRYNGVNLGTASLVSDGNATNTIWILTAGAGDTFNSGLLPGSVISINNTAFTVYQVRSSTVIEIAEDATGILTNGSTYAWAIPAGQIIAGQGAQHMWGPYGTGVSGSVIFGCGVANAAGILFWTNGNDPDSSDIVNSLQVTSPSEPLRGGCIYNGLAYVWSTERMFQIFPSLTVSGQFYVQEIVGGKGLWQEWSLTVQSTSIADQSITWRGKDGIYNWTPGGGTVSLTDAALYPWFPHESGPGIGFEALFPGTINLTPVPNTRLINPPDDSQPLYQRLTWFDGVLFYDHKTATGVYNTLVFDSKQGDGGWISVDHYFVLADPGGPVARCPEVGGPGTTSPGSSQAPGNNLKMSVAGVILDYGGALDSGNRAVCAVLTKQDDLGDSRAQKLFGDFMMDATAGTSGGISITPYINLGVTALTTQNFTTSSRAQTPIDLATNGLGFLSNTFGLLFSWNQDSSAALYQYNFSFVPKPILTGHLALDKTDDGYHGAKYILGFSIECNTYVASVNQTRSVNVLVDGGAVINPVTSTPIFTISTGTNTQLELPFAISPSVGTEMQIAIDASDTAAQGWEVFSVRWVWIKWPDFTQQNTPLLTPFASRTAYIRGFTIPVETQGHGILLTANFNQGASVPTYSLGTFTGPANKKTPVAFAFEPPVIASAVELVPSDAWRMWPEEIAWDAEVWPELIGEWSNWISPTGRGKPSFIRGLTLPIDTNGAVLDVKLRFDDNTTYDLGAVQTIAGIKTPTPLVLPHSQGAGRVHHVVRVEPQGKCRIWWDQIVWDAEEYPESSGEDTPILNCGYARAKFMQGVVIPIDTSGQNVTLQIYNMDTGVSAFASPVINTTGKTAVALSWPPFIAHLVQIVPSTACRIFYEEASWIWEPTPELALFWTTPFITHGMSGWLHQRLSWFAYLSTTQVNFVRNFSDGTSDAYILPSTGGIYSKMLLPLLPKKFLAVQYSATSSAAIKVFVNDCEFHTKSWGSESSYSVQRPIGSSSVVSGAQI
jgi:hypothetical protein